jgi:ubiquitin C-terminal hydrolase
LQFFLLTPFLQIDLGQLYADLMPGTLYRLRAMVCYYGRHYSAFVHLPQLSRWVTFDDSSAGSIGSWSDVRQRCESGRVQPSVLFYEAVS